MNGEIKEKNLQKDVKEFVKKSIKKVKSVQDVVALFNFNITIRNINEEDVSKKLMESKMVLQLYINLYNYYDIFKKCTIKDAVYSHLKNATNLLDSFYELDKNKKIWKCYARPNEIDMEEALYDFVFYFLIMRNLEKSFVNKEIVIEICSFCDSDIPPGKNQCDVCNTPITDMIIVQRKDQGVDQTKDKNSKEYFANENLIKEQAYNSDNNNDDVKEDSKANNNFKQNFDEWRCGKCEFFNEYSLINCKVCQSMYKDGKWICAECTVENNCVKEECSVCKSINIYHKRMINNEASNEMRSKKKDNDVKIGKDEWKCGQCGLLQSFDFIDCGACGESRGVKGVWKCHKCTMINKCDNVGCGACDEENDHLKKKYCESCKKNEVSINEVKCGECRKNDYVMNKDDDMKIGKDEWKCGKCGLLQSFDFIDCGACRESRRVKGVWKCDKCTMINKCDNVGCGACNEENDHLKKKYCESCKKNEVSQKEMLCHDCLDCTDYKWQCSFDHCKKMNKMSHTFCFDCHYWRYNKFNRGDLLKKLFYDEEIFVWHCYKCTRTYNGDKTFCEHCGESRYERRYCIDCGECNDGRSLCNKC